MKRKELIKIFMMISNKKKKVFMVYTQIFQSSNNLTAGVDYIPVFHVLISTLNTSFWGMLNIKRDINQQDLKIVCLYFVKSE